MKSALLLMLVSAAVALAQIPAKSVVNGLTIDVADIQVPVPYGAAETKAVISVCSATAVTRIDLEVAVLFPDSVSHSQVYELVPPTNAGGVYCAAMVALGARAKITYLSATAANRATVMPPPAPVTSENTAGRRR